MQTAIATRLGTRQAWIALSATLLAASIALVGCSPTQTHASLPTPADTPSSPAGYYQDNDANFAITFPGKPSVEPIAGNSSGAMRANYSTGPDPTAPDVIYYTASGTTAAEVEITPDSLEGTLFRFIQSSGSMTDPKTIELDGLPAVTADFTFPDDKPATAVVAGKGHSYYLLIVRGGTPAERQQFFDSFKLLS